MDYMNASVEEKQEMEKELKTLVRKKKRMKSLILLVLVAAVLLVGIGAAWIAGRNDSKAEIEELQDTIEYLQKIIEDNSKNPDVVDPVSPQIVLDSVTKEISEIGELATVEYLFTNAAKYTDSKQIKNWNIPLTEKSFTIKWDGVIKAGIQVEQIDVKMDESQMKIIVTIPSAEILSYDTDEDSVEVLDETDNKFNPITIGDKVKFDAETENEMKERAIENGILDKAQDNAERIICSILTANANITGNYAIEFVRQ